MSFHIASPTLANPFHIALVGAGGSGSQMLTCLARLHRAMTALGHHGFNVTTYDPDAVSDANVGRQMFSPADIGRNKAHVLTNRVNAFFGLAWTAVDARFGTPQWETRIVISCVDTRESRRQIDNNLRRARNGAYLLDLGNRAADGQAILGQYARPDHDEYRSSVPGHVDLPTPYTLLPELIADGAEDNAPSCSLAEALERQELFVNDDVTRAGSLILWNLLRRGRLAWHGAFTNCLTGRRSTIPVDPEVWKRMTPAAAVKKSTKAPTKRKPTRRTT